MCLQGIGQLQQSSNHYCVVQCASARRVIAIKPSVSHPARSLCRLDPPPAAVAIAVAPPTVTMMATVIITVMMMAMRGLWCCHRADLEILMIYLSFPEAFRS
jgi:hypothetical protein